MQNYCWQLICHSKVLYNDAIGVEASHVGMKQKCLAFTQSTSSILDASSAAPSTSSSGGRSSSSPNPSSSSSMLRPSLIMRWMRPANWVGSSRLKPEVSREVSKRSQIKSLTVLSDLSAAAFFLSSVMMECLGLTRRAWAFMMRSILAAQPYSEVVSTQGESAMRPLTTTFSTLSPSTSFISLVRGSNSAFISSNFFFSSSSSTSRPSFVVDFSFFPSNSLSCCTAYSSTGSTMYMTSKPFFLRFSRKGEDDTAVMLSPVM